MKTGRSPNTSMRNLPSVEQIAQSPVAVGIAELAGQRTTIAMIRTIIDCVRNEIADGTLYEIDRDAITGEIHRRLTETWGRTSSLGITRVINATGVIIHTNLGRSPLSEAARVAIADAAGYCTLEFDIVAGGRGGRGRVAENLVAELTGAEAALMVNNCAAAAFFVLTVFASGGEVIISRGELVEIGGDFRVPDVLSQSGATLREVGTTNRTKLADYEQAISESTRMLLRVHPSNYRVVGFTAAAELRELVELAATHGLIVYEDIGSGALIDLSRFGVTDEPTVAASIAAGVDLVTFSGDKLLGGPQAGIIAGRRAAIEKLRKHPLYRVLRIDKLRNAALEATLREYRRDAAGEVPVIEMIARTKEKIGLRAVSLVEKLTGDARKLELELVDGVSAIGGGAAPTVELPTVLLSARHTDKSASVLEYELRMGDPPVLTRIAEDRVLIDLRTVSVSEDAEILAALAEIG